MTALEAANEMIRQGVIEVRSDGTIWKLKNLNAMPFTAPRRLETRTKGGYLAVRVDINHHNGIKTDNHPRNLELATRSQNVLHSYRVLGRKLSKSITPVLAKVAPRAKALRAQGLPYSQIAKALGVSQTTAFRATWLKSAPS